MKLGDGGGRQAKHLHLRCQSTSWRNITGLLALWDGTIDLPRGLGARLRLVVAEYEEYIVDDEAPYDDVPEEKGRRLVFVEHVELD